jgi:hypothetical protein
MRLVAKLDVAAACLQQAGFIPPPRDGSLPAAGGVGRAGAGRVYPATQNDRL